MCIVCPYVQICFIGCPFLPRRPAGSVHARRDGMEGGGMEGLDARGKDGMLTGGRVARGEPLSQVRS